MTATQQQRSATTRRDLRRLERRRRRGGHGRGPVVLQRGAGAVAGWLTAARARIGHAVRGDRPLIVAVLGVLALGAVVLSGPAQSYLDARGRVDTLEAQAAALEAENRRLEARADDLQDPETVELLARESQGFIRPGEVPYALVPPEVDRPRITAPRDGSPPEPDPWYVRAWERVRAAFG